MTDFGSDPPRSSSPLPPPPPNLSPPPGYVGGGYQPPPPPGYMAYAGPGNANAGTLRSVGRLSNALVVLMIVFVPLQLLSLASVFTLRDKARQYLAGDITSRQFTDAQANVGILAGLLIIPIAVLTIILMYRMADNLRMLGRSDATWKPGWAIGGWFCPPFAVYAIPWLMFRELWKGSDPQIAPHDPSWKSGPVSPLINVWWVLYGLVPLVGFATSAGFVTSFNNFSTRKLAERLDEFWAINAALAAVLAICGVVYLLMIRQLSARHMAATRET